MNAELILKEQKQLRADVAALMETADPDAVKKFLSAMDQKLSNGLTKLEKTVNDRLDEWEKKNLKPADGKKKE